MEKFKINAEELPEEIEAEDLNEACDKVMEHIDIHNIKEFEEETGENIYAECGICGNTSGYDKESLEGSTWNINGIKIVLCCPCEDDLRKVLKIK